MKLSQIREVLAVAEFGSLRAAGRHLGVGQPTITRSIRDIEHELGAALFDRESKGVRLTAIGVGFVRRATTVVQELRRAREEIHQLKGGSVGQVNVAVSVAAGLALLPGVSQQFRQRYPEGLLLISESTSPPSEADTHDGRIELYVGTLDASAPRPSFVVEKLFDHGRVILARKGHPLASAGHLKDLTVAEWIHPMPSSHHAEAEFEGVFTSQGLPAPRIVMHSKSALLTVLTVASTDLLTVGPRQWLDCMTGTGGLAPIQIAHAFIPTPVCLVRRGSIPLTPMAEYLCDLFRRAGADYRRRQLEDLSRFRAPIPRSAVQLTRCSA
jgi:LysR family transcriptional regulator, regulator of abg operon